MTATITSDVTACWQSLSQSASAYSIDHLVQYISINKNASNIPYNGNTSFTRELEQILGTYNRLFGYSMVPPQALTSADESQQQQQQQQQQQSIHGATNSITNLVNSPEIVMNISTTAAVASAAASEGEANMHSEIDAYVKLSQRVQCAASFGRRHFCSAPHKTATPPLLLSFPGAGW